MFLYDASFVFENNTVKSYVYEYVIYFVFHYKIII